MKIRIFNDGKPARDTKITNVETGEEIEHITHLQINMHAIDPIYAKLTVYKPILDIIVDAEVECVCPYCGKPQEE